MWLFLTCFATIFRLFVCVHLLFEIIRYVLLFLFQLKFSIMSSTSNDELKLLEKRLAKFSCEVAYFKVCLSEVVFYSSMLAARNIQSFVENIFNRDCFYVRLVVIVVPKCSNIVVEFTMP